MHKKVKKPHILYVVMDDQGYGDVGYTYPEQADMRTPLLDKLASEGLLFVLTAFFFTFCVFYSMNENSWLSHQCLTVIQYFWSLRITICLCT